MLMGRGTASQRKPGRRPTDEGLKLTPPSAAQHAVQQRLENKHGPESVGASKPRVVLAWAALRRQSQGAVGHRQGSLAQSLVADAQGANSDLEELRCRHPCHRRDHVRLPQSACAPVAAEIGHRGPRWETTRAGLRPKSASLKVETRYPVVPSIPAAAWVSRSLLYEYEDQLNPWWLYVEGFVRSGSADAHILVAHVVAEKASEWGAKCGS